MSLLNYLGEVAGYRSRGERQEQQLARARVILEKPEMSEIAERRVIMSFGMRAARDFGVALAWLFLSVVLFQCSHSDLPAWSQTGATVGFILSLPMLAGNLVTGTIQALRAGFTRFDWVAFEQMMIQTRGHSGT